MQQQDSFIFNTGFIYIIQFPDPQLISTHQYIYTFDMTSQKSFLFFFSTTPPQHRATSWISFSHLPMFCLPHCKPIQPNGKGAWGIHGLKELIIDFSVGLCCWFSWTAAPGRRRQTPSIGFPSLSLQHGTSMRLFFPVHLVALSSFWPACLAGPFSKHMPLTITNCHSTKEEDKGTLTSSLSLAYFARLVIKILAGNVVNCLLILL